MKISFGYLGVVLRKFDRNGTFTKHGNWSIANGGYDLWWEIYYKGYTVLRCVAGELQGGFRPVSEFDDAAEERLIQIVRGVYGI